METKLRKEIPNCEELIPSFGNLYLLLEVVMGERGSLLGTYEKSPVRGYPNRARRRWE